MFLAHGGEASGLPLPLQNGSITLSRFDLLLNADFIYYVKLLNM